jgi:hypothetical protein
MEALEGQRALGLYASGLMQCKEGGTGGEGSEKKTRKLRQERRMRLPCHFGVESRGFDDSNSQALSNFIRHSTSRILSRIRDEATSG